MVINQQQLAYMRPLIPLQSVQAMTVSWQLSMQKGMQQQMPVKRNTAKHQMYVTPPACFLLIWSVYRMQKGQGSRVFPVLGTNPWLFGTKP